MATKVRGSILIDVEKCKGCKVCESACPKDVIGFSTEVNAKGFHYAYMVNPEACIGCANCAIVCPDGVVTVYRKKI